MKISHQRLQELLDKKKQKPPSLGNILSELRAFGCPEETRKAQVERLKRIGGMLPILGVQITAINEHERLISRCREMMIHAGAYSEKDFQMLLHQAEKESAETVYSFSDCLPRVVMKYINERSAS